MKKKGRKPVAKIHNKETISNLTDKECLIAHIPLTLEKINNYNLKKNKYNEIVNIKNNEKINNNDFTIKSDLFSNKSTNVISDNKKLLDKIALLESKLKNVQNKKTDQIHYNYSSINLKNNINENNNLKCWWCCHGFENKPVYLPENIINNEYCVYGYFCSFNCASAFNIDKNDDKVWERATYLNKFKQEITGKFEKITPAPPKYILDIFGGDINIDEFRNKFSILDKSYRFILPPLRTIIPIIEEKSSNSINIDNNNILGDNLVLKRSKPISKNNNTIQKAMNLKYS